MIYERNDYKRKYDIVIIFGLTIYYNDYPLIESSARFNTVACNIVGCFSLTSFDVEFAKIVKPNCDSLSSRPLGSNLTCMSTVLSFLKGLPMEHDTRVALYRLQIMESLLLLAI